jgi:hypothetical protein
MSDTRNSPDVASVYVGFFVFFTRNIETEVRRGIGKYPTEGYAKNHTNLYMVQIRTEHTPAALLHFSKMSRRETAYEASLLGCIRCHSIVRADILGARWTWTVKARIFLVLIGQYTQSHLNALRCVSTSINFAVTGSPTTMPYGIQQRRYSPKPPFLALRENSWRACIYGSFAGFAASSIVAALSLRGAAASPDPRKANSTSMRLCSVLSELQDRSFPSYRTCTLIRYASIFESYT